MIEWLKKKFNKKPATFTLVVREPLSDQITERELEVTGESLFKYLSRGGDQGWKNVAAVRIGAAARPDHFWPHHRPRPGERIEIYPGTGAKSFTDAYIARLNAQQDGGQFLKAAVLTETNIPLVKRYFVDHDKQVVFDGKVYQPLPMAWHDYSVEASMNLPALKVVVPNLGVSVPNWINMVDYLEQIDVLEHDVELQLLHIDLLNDPTARDTFKFQIQLIEGDDEVVIFNLGLNLGLQDLLPRRVVTKDRYPGIVDTTGRINI